MTTKAPSKDAMNDAEGLHAPCSCVDDKTHKRMIAETLDDIAAGAVQNLVELTAAHIVVTLDRDALRARNVALVEASQAALTYILGHSQPSNFEMRTIRQLRAALAADAEAGEDR